MEDQSSREDFMSVSRDMSRAKKTNQFLFDGSNRLSNSYSESSSESSSDSEGDRLLSSSDQETPNPSSVCCNIL